MHKCSHRLPSGLPIRGRSYYGVAPRTPVLAGSVRPDWRAAIESGSDSGDEAPSSSRGGAPVSVQTLEPAAAPRAQPQAVSPEPQPPVAAAAALQATDVTPTVTSASASAAAAEGQGAPAQREEPFSLPTVDLGELLAQPPVQSAAFGALAGVSGVLALLCFIEPEAVLALALPKAAPSDIDVTFVRIIGVTLAASASVEYSLKHAAESQLLKSATYQRLMAGCAAKSAGFLAVLLATSPATFRLWSPMAWAAYLITAVGSAGVNLAVISHSSGKGLAPPQLEPSLPANPTSWAYAACTALYLLTVAACFAPEALFTGDPPSDITPLVKGVWAPGFLLAAVMSYVLKDAADRGRLGASTFKNLNLGIAALEYGYSVIFGSAILSDQVPLDSPALSNLGGSLAIATFALYTYATAKK